MQNTTDESINQAQSLAGEEQPPRHSGPKRPNRLRACIACRNTKTRCIPLENRSACKSCYKHSRECVMPGPAKPRTRGRLRISELERKLQLLTDALTIKDTSHQRDLPYEGSSNDTSNIPTRNENDDTRDTSRPTHLHDAPGMLRSSKDDILRLDIDSPTVSMLYNHWTLQVRPFLPLVSLPPDENPTLLRSTKPLLYIAILTVASMSLLPAASSQLTKHLYDELACRTYVGGKQSIELVQALLLSSHYLVSPDNPTEFPFLPHVYIASSISYDLGLDRQARSHSGLTDIKKAEAARTWLAAHYSMSISAILLRRQRLIFDGAATISIMTDLLNNASAAASDKTLSCLVRLQSIIEDTSMTIGTISWGKETEFDNPSTQYQLKALRRRVNQWKDAVSEELDSSLLSHMYHSARLYIHQIAIRAYICKRFSVNREFGGVIHDLNLSLSATHIDALGICLDSSQKVFHAFFSLDLTVIRCLPSIYLLWNLFTAVCMVKMVPYVESQQKSGVSGTTTEQGIYGAHSITQLLNAMTNKIEMACQHDYMSHGKPFITAFKRLRVWYLQKSAMCLNSRQSCDHVHTDDVDDLLASGSNGQSRPPSESHPSSTTGVGGLNVVPPPLKEVTDQRDIHAQDLHQGGHLSASKSIWPSSIAAPPSLLSFPVEASHLENVSDPIIDSGFSLMFENSDFIMNQFDESILTTNDQWLRGLLWPDGTL